MTALARGANPSIDSPTLQWLDTVDSTNTRCVQSMPVDGGTKALLIGTDHQTAGRGRRGRSWHSEPGRSLCLSYARPVIADPALIAQIPLVTGYAVASFFRALSLPVKLKWPNDLLAMGKKLAGILCESVPMDTGYWVVAGIGVNLRSVAVDDALDGAGAIGLEQICPSGKAKELLDAQALAQTLGHQIHHAIDQWLEHGLAPWIEPMRNIDAWLGQTVAIYEKGVPLMQGKALGMNSQGHYLLDTPTGIQAVVSGDLSLRVA